MRNYSRGFVPYTQFQGLERKVCMGRVFTYNTAVNCKDTNLTYLKLTEYYNELVLQLKLVEHNLNVGITREFNEANKNDSLKKEREIFTLLNESVLPALELIVSYYYYSYT